VGIPRFSQFDSARARIGSFIINIIVAVSQFFCVLFCFVGWGWSIWWGTIMLRCASKEKVSHFKLQPLIPHSCCTYREIEQNQKGGAFGAGGGATPGATGGGWEKRRRRGGFVSLTAPAATRAAGSAAGHEQLGAASAQTALLDIILVLKELLTAAPD